MRNAIRKDLVFYALPAASVYCAGLVVTARDLTRRLESLYRLSLQSAAGLTLMVVGLAVAIVAAATLGRFYSSTLLTRKDHQLITRGIYRFVRHPVYLGAIMVCIGIPVYASSLRGFLIMLVLIPVFLNRIRIEERMLTDEFGDAYRAYKETTRKLIPFVY
jgi:protein-S-isoprenylcysteine O-methyltransferase Ste14